MAVQPTPYVETALSHSAELFRRTLQSGLPIGSAGGVVPATPAASANINAGVAGCSDLQVTAPASGMSVNISAGQCIVCGTLGSGSGYGIGKGYGMPTVTLNGGSAPTVASNAAATQVQLTTQGAYYAYNDDSSGAVNLAVASSDPTNPRIDVVIAQIEDAAYSGSNNDFKLAVVTGTAAASPVVPTLPANSLVLAYVWVPATATSIIAGDILDLRVAYNRNPFSFRVSAATQTFSASGTVHFGTVVHDLTGSFNAATYTYTYPVTGLWLVSVRAALTMTSTATNSSLALDSGSNQVFDQVPTLSGDTYSFHIDEHLPQNEGDTVIVNYGVGSTGSVINDGRWNQFYGTLLSPL